MLRNTTKEVEAMHRLSITGNITPIFWYSNLRLIKNTKNGDSNKPHLLAIAILSDIVYWYKPTVIRDEITGQITEISKRFALDKLQRSPSQVSKRFGISKLDASEAIQYLVSKNLITTELRMLVKDGKKQPNTMFIGINVDEIERISYMKDSDICDNRGVAQKDGSSQLSSRGSSQLSSRGSSQLTTTNTENTETEISHTENTFLLSKISHEIFESAEKEISDKNEKEKNENAGGVSLEKKLTKPKKAKLTNLKERTHLHSSFIEIYQDFHKSIKGSAIPNSIFTRHTAPMKGLRLLMIEATEKYRTDLGYTTETTDEQILNSFKGFLAKSWIVCENDLKFSNPRFSPKYLFDSYLELINKIKNNTKNGNSAQGNGYDANGFRSNPAMQVLNSIKAHQATTGGDTGLDEEGIRQFLATMDAEDRERPV